MTVPFDGVGRDARIGLNFTEVGSGLRAGMTVYDRGRSATSGIGPGDVFSVWTPGPKVADTIAHGGNKISANYPPNKVQLPDEFNGHVMVFRSFGRVSYGLIMNGIRPARVHDKLKSPDHL